MYNSCFPPFPTLEHLRIDEDRDSQPQWQGYMQSAQWLDLFQSFTSVKDLGLSKNFVGFVAPALGGLTGQQVIEVLPALQILFLDGLQSPGPANIRHSLSILQFVAT
jgi:hypothetical protein